MADRKSMNKAYNEVIDFGYDILNDFVEPDDVEGAELTDQVFNRAGSEFTIYTHEAIEFLERVGVFDAIEKVKDYQQDNFGKVMVDFSEPVQVANNYAYIIGEEIFSEIDLISSKWDEKLSGPDIEAIKKEMEKMKKK